MTDERMNGWLKSKGGVAIVGAVLVALATIFGFIGAVPWASKTEVAAMKSDIQRELSEIKADLREVVRLMRRNGRHGTP